MEQLYADLHLHTAYSDGTFSPVELVRQAQRAGLSAISITDHDITDGITEGLKEGAKRGIEVIPGVELSAEMKSSGEREMHILGYYINWESVKFQEELKLFRQARERRAFHILDKLAQVGIKLDEERLFKIAGIGSIGRLHFAKAMMEAKIVTHTQEAFEKYLGEGRPAYVPKLRLQPEEAIQMIHRIGGLPVLAHPFYGGINKAAVKSLVNKGLMGIEVWHIKHPPE
ncbi:MAG: PHP domain-containing protein, partial [Endomicrobiia bacterium]|nr:PHP domain-containing protein [Endomicrobiia bacterium]